MPQVIGMGSCLFHRRDECERRILERFDADLTQPTLIPWSNPPHFDAVHLSMHVGEPRRRCRHPRCGPG